LCPCDNRGAHAAFPPPFPFFFSSFSPQPAAWKMDGEGGRGQELMIIFFFLLLLFFFFFFFFSRDVDNRRHSMWLRCFFLFPIPPLPLSVPLPPCSARGGSRGCPKMPSLPSRGASLGRSRDPPPSTRVGGGRALGEAILPFGWVGTGVF